LAELGITLIFFRRSRLSINQIANEDYVNTYYELRKAKNVTLGNGQRFNGGRIYFGTMMVYRETQTEWFLGLLTTQHTILPALQFIKTKQIVVLFLRCFYVS
jgi:phosphate acetyltransferase